MQFHGGVYRSDDAGESWHDIAPGLPSDFGFPLAIDPADPDSAYVIPLVADMDRVTPEGRVRVYETRDAGASWTPRGDGLPPEHAYLTILREAFDWAGEGEALELYFGATSGGVFGSGDAGRELVRRGDAPAARAISLRRLKRKRKSMSQEAVLPDAGSRDLAAAAAALRSRLPEPLAALAAIAYNYRWSWTPGGPELFASVDEERWELCAANPVRLLQEAHPERLAELAADAGLPRAHGRARGGRRRRGRRADHRRRRHAGAPGRLLLRRVRDPRLAAGVLRRPRRPRRRHPQGGLRPPAAAGRDRAHVPPRLLPPAHRRLRLAARVLGRHRSRPRPRRARHRRRRRAADGDGPGRRARGRARRSGASTSGASRCCCSTPTGPRTASPTAGSPRASTSATPTCGCGSTRCSASAACGR